MQLVMERPLLCAGRMFAIKIDQAEEIKYKYKRKFKPARLCHLSSISHKRMHGEDDTARIKDSITIYDLLLLNVNNLYDHSE